MKVCCNLLKIKQINHTLNFAKLNFLTHKEGKTVLQMQSEQQALVEELLSPAYKWLTGRGRARNSLFEGSKVEHNMFLTTLLQQLIPTILALWSLHIIFSSNFMTASGLMNAFGGEGGEGVEPLGPHPLWICC